MNPLDDLWIHDLSVRFHFGGVFFNDGRKLHYVGGKEGVSFIDRDKISLPEVMGHLRDHYNVADAVNLHWLFPGKALLNGLRVLVDDQACLDMCQCITDAGAADIFVEDIAENGDGQSLELEKFAEYMSSPEQVQKDLEGCSKYMNWVREKDRTIMQEMSINDSAPVQSDNSSESDSDEEYLPGDDESSEEDEEAVQISQELKELKHKLETRGMHVVDEVGHEVNVENLMASNQWVTSLEEDDSTNLDSEEDDDSYDETSEGELVKKERKFPRFNGSAAVPSFSIGMTFSDKSVFREAVIKYGIAERKVIKFVKNEAAKCRAVCSWPNCPWVLHLSKTSRSTSWQLATCKDVHTCPPRRDNTLVTSKRIADKYEKMIKANPQWPIQSMRETIQEEMFADVSASKIKRAKSIVMQRMYDATKGEYGMVFDYQQELLRSNPGSTIVVKLDPDEPEDTFMRFYVCFDACKKGFLAGCRKVIGVDGCFFKGLTNGELLCALGRDANNQMYPIAWAVVERETKNSWDFFLALLSNDLKFGDGDGWVFISDQQKGLINAVNKWAPRVEHRMCARHIYANWRKKFTNKKYQKLFWRCAKSSSMNLFNYNLNKLRAETPQGADAILRTNPEHWSRAWFKIGSFCDSVDNNMCECFNQWILKARFLPIISMLEGIRRQVMVRIQENKSKAERWSGPICPNTYKKLMTYITASGNCHAVSNGNNCYEVTYWEHRFSVNLEDRTCSCRFWQLSGLPCPHAISSIYYASLPLENFVAKCYSVEEYNKTYAHCLQPVEGRPFWPLSDRERPLPPKYVRMPGRPKKERIRQEGEKRKPTKGKLSKKGTVVRCRVCKGIGHNRTTCSSWTGSGNGTGGASQTNRGSGVGSQANRATASQPPTASGAASQSTRASGGGSTQSKRKSCPSATTGSTKRHCSQLSVQSNASKIGMHSSARVKTKLKNGAEAKVTLEATAPGMTGKHSKATVHISGPSTSKVVVSATGELSKKKGANGSKKKGATSSTLLLRGPSP